MTDIRQEQFDALAHAYPVLNIRARFKQAPEDFVVVEQLPFELSGQGEHAWLRVRKRDSNTEWVAAKLADHAGVKRQAVGYAGLKDRFAVTTQWFSVQLPGREDVDWSDFKHEGVEVLTATRHSRKLQRGALQSNSFTVRLRGIESEDDQAFEQLAQRCELIGQQGVPNYFGAQRFGRDMRNLVDAEAMFLNARRRLPRHKRGLLLSAARSWLFNAILSERVRRGNWNRRAEGDVFMLDGRSACFSDDGSEDLDRRLADGEIHPTAVLWGDGQSMAAAECAALEAEIVDSYPVFRQGLIDARVDQQRRSLRVPVRDLAYHREGADMVLRFRLQAGSYATMVLRELVKLGDNRAES